MNINPIDIQFYCLLYSFHCGVQQWDSNSSINIFLSIIISQYAVYLLPQNMLSNNLCFLFHLFSYLYFLYGFILNTIIYNLDSVK